jgi:hypothetical protein
VGTNFAVYWVLLLMLNLKQWLFHKPQVPSDTCLT